MYIKPLSPKEDIPVVGSTISNARAFSVFNNSGAACQIRVDNGEVANAQPTLPIGSGESVIVVKLSDETVYAEDLSGTSVSGVFATKIAFGN